MKMLFKLYLLGQLIALPFMVGAIGGALSGESESGPIATGTQIEAASNLRSVSNHELCEALNGPATNPVQDDLQQLRFITAELYGEDVASDCFGTRFR